VTGSSWPPSRRGPAPASAAFPVPFVHRLDAIASRPHAAPRRRMTDRPGAVSQRSSFALCRSYSAKLIAAGCSPLAAARGGTVAPGTIGSSALRSLNPREKERSPCPCFPPTRPCSPLAPTTSHRPMGDIAGLREIHDDVGRLTVSAFPFAMVKDISPARAAVRPATSLPIMPRLYRRDRQRRPQAVRPRRDPPRPLPRGLCDLGL